MSALRQKVVDYLRLILGLKSGAPINRKNLAIRIGCIVAGLIVISLLLTAIFGSHLSRTEQSAVDDSVKAADGFDKKSPGYSFTQMNKAVEYALNNKCTEARAVYNDAADHPNGLKKSDVAAYKKRINDICSGSVAEPAHTKNQL